MSVKSDQPVTSTLEELLLGVVDHYVADVPYHPWFDERNRWYELVVCILFAYGGKTDGTARSAGDVLARLGLLDVSTLADLPGDGKVDLDQSPARLIADVLTQMGYDPGDIASILGQLRNIARDLRNNRNCRIQVYLRSQGERMLSAMQKDWGCVQSKKDERFQNALVMWLQNVLTMPVYLNTASTVQFCKAAGCSLDELQQAADELNISASLLDDMLDLWAADQED